MVTKIRRKKTGKTYLLVGTGFGTFKAMAMANTFHSMNPEIDEGELGMVAACDSTGSIHWIDHRDVEVIEVDGVKPSELLGEC